MNETDRKRMNVDGDVDLWFSIAELENNMNLLNMKISISILLFIYIKQLQHCKLQIT